MSHGNTISDATPEWLIANGANPALGNQVNDLWHSMLISQGADVLANSEERNDMWFALLGSLGWTGALNDREKAFWDAGGILGDIPVFDAAALDAAVILYSDDPLRENTDGVVPTFDNGAFGIYAGQRAAVARFINRLMDADYWDHLAYCNLLCGSTYTSDVVTDRNRNMNYIIIGPANALDFGAPIQWPVGPQVNGINGMLCEQDNQWFFGLANDVMAPAIPDCDAFIYVQQICDHQNGWLRNLVEWTAGEDPAHIPSALSLELTGTGFAPDTTSRGRNASELTDGDPNFGSVHTNNTLYSVRGSGGFGVSKPIDTKRNGVILRSISETRTADVDAAYGICWGNHGGLARDLQAYLNGVISVVGVLRDGKQADPEFTNYINKLVFDMGVLGA